MHSQSQNQSNTILWGLSIALVIHSVLMVFHLLPTYLNAPLMVVLLTSFMVLHGLRSYSGVEVVAFFVIGFVVSNAYENLSVMTGFPFGDYYYTDKFGAKLFLVPLVIAPAYIGMGYLSWMLAQVLLGTWGRSLRGSERILVPVIASFVMVMWDLVMDPKSATIYQFWIWEDGGDYFGVPFVNFLGWLLCVYTIFQLFALFLARREKSGAREQKPQMMLPAYWYTAVLGYASVALNQGLRALDKPENTTVYDAAGVAWQTDHINSSMGLITIFTMGFVILLSSMLIARSTQKEN
ncbi:carotenoid biosynthesis protein [Spongiibacter sp. KMU-166]|uniref:Carotenoid biosynthesis protein n=1 Tax=Spongiibacter thalassae TaxID=2721624 RepID=A0ABX1GHK6_9GAMM|nr:carotenoid biosynthesis protein [Spongiibacter thalassae]NKI18685.1 carotenoid biosynthesis protein [Spongiibacter thalassae]